MGSESLLQALCARAYPENLFQKVGNILSSKEGSSPSRGSITQCQPWKGGMACPVLPVFS